MAPGTPRIVLTGGIGSGKSTAAGILAELGATVVDADRIGHDLLEPGGAGFGAVAARWPKVLSGGRIDRRALGRVVFADQAQLRELEAVLHPLISAEISRRVDRLPSDCPVVVELSVPKDLVGPGWTTLVIDAPDDLRRQRLAGRGMAPDEIEGRMAAQPGRAQWQALGDVVIENAGTAGDLRDRLEEVLDRLTSAVEE